MQKVAIVIPVYKPGLDGNEKVSIRRTLKVLGRYPIVLVCPEDMMDTSQYEGLANATGVVLQIERFAPHFFEGIEGYNRLMLSKLFYARFSEFEFILISQPDAYVFRDDLMAWCGKGYDFVGAPIFGRFTDKVFHPKQSRVGNGGFSLRRVEAFLDYFDGRKHVIRTKDIAKCIDLKKKPMTRWAIWLLMALGWRNKPSSVAKQWKYNEDDFWSGMLNGTRYELSKPEVEEALLFAFERFPSEAYAITGTLPFGCHAWAKYQYESFWKTYIEG